MPLINPDLITALLGKNRGAGEGAPPGERVATLCGLDEGSRFQGKVMGTKGPVTLISVNDKTITAQSDIPLPKGSEVMLELVKNGSPAKVKLISILRDQESKGNRLNREFLNLKAGISRITLSMPEQEKTGTVPGINPAGQSPDETGMSVSPDRSIPLATGKDPDPQQVIMTAKFTSALSVLSPDGAKHAISDQFAASIFRLLTGSKGAPAGGGDQERGQERGTDIKEKGPQNSSATWEDRKEGQRMAKRETPFSTGQKAGGREAVNSKISGPTAGNAPAKPDGNPIVKPANPDTAPLTNATFEPAAQEKKQAELAGTHKNSKGVTGQTTVPSHEKQAENSIGRQENFTGTHEKEPSGRMLSDNETVPGKGRSSGQHLEKATESPGKRGSPAGQPAITGKAAAAINREEMETPGKQTVPKAGGEAVYNSGEKAGSGNRLSATSVRGEAGRGETVPHDKASVGATGNLPSKNSVKNVSAEMRPLPRQAMSAGKTGKQPAFHQLSETSGSPSDSVNIPAESSGEGRAAGSAKEQTARQQAANLPPPDNRPDVGRQPGHLPFSGRSQQITGSKIYEKPTFPGTDHHNETPQKEAAIMRPPDIRGETAGPDGTRPSQDKQQELEFIFRKNAQPAEKQPPGEGTRQIFTEREKEMPDMDGAGRQAAENSPAKEGKTDSVLSRGIRQLATHSDMLYQYQRHMEQEPGVQFFMFPLWFANGQGSGHWSWWRDGNKDESGRGSDISHIAFDLELGNLGQINLHLVLEERDITFHLTAKKEALPFLRRGLPELEEIMEGAGFMLRMIEFFPAEYTSSNGMATPLDIPDQRDGNVHIVT